MVKKSQAITAEGKRSVKFSVTEGLYNRPECVIIDSTTVLAMAQLIVRKLEETVVRKLKARAGLHGVSTEEEHRRILCEALLGKRRRTSLKDFLLAMPDICPDSVFEREPDKGRQVVL